jgi:hypothetical protein
VRLARRFAVRGGARGDAGAASASDIDVGSKRAKRRMHMVAIEEIFTPGDIASAGNELK